MKTIQNAVTIALVLLILIVVLLALTLSAVAQLRLGGRAHSRARLGGAPIRRRASRITGGNLKELEIELEAVQAELAQQRTEKQRISAETVSVREQLAANTDNIHKVEKDLEERAAALKQPNGAIALKYRTYVAEDKLAVDKLVLCTNKQLEEIAALEKERPKYRKAQTQLRVASEELSQLRAGADPQRSQAYRPMILERTAQELRELELEDEIASICRQLAAHQKRLEDSKLLDEAVESADDAVKIAKDALEVFNAEKKEFVQQQESVGAARAVLITERERLNQLSTRLQRKNQEAENRISRLENTLKIIVKEIESARKAEADRNAEAAKVAERNRLADVVKRNAAAEAAAKAAAIAAAQLRSTAAAVSVDAALKRDAMLRDLAKTDAVEANRKRNAWVAQQLAAENAEDAERAERARNLAAAAARKADSANAKRLAAERERNLAAAAAAEASALAAAKAADLRRKEAAAASIQSKLDLEGELQTEAALAAMRASDRTAQRLGRQQAIDDERDESNRVKAEAAAARKADSANAKRLAAEDAERERNLAAAAAALAAAEAEAKASALRRNEAADASIRRELDLEAMQRKEAADRAKSASDRTEVRLAQLQDADDEKDRIDDVNETLGIDAEDAAAVYHQRRKLPPVCDYTVATDCLRGPPTVKQSWQHEQRARVNLAIEAASIQCAASIADAPAHRTRAGRLFAVVPAAETTDPLRTRQLFAERVGQRLPAAATNSVGTNSFGTNSSNAANTRGAKTKAALALVHVYELQRTASGCMPSLLTSFRA